MAQQGTPGQSPGAGPPPPNADGDLTLSAERRAALEPKLRALLREFRDLETLAGPEVEPWYARPLAREEDDAR